MKKMMFVCSVVLGLLTGCASAPRVSDVPEEPDSPLRSLCESGKYHEAMRELPRAMAAWAKYTERTGRTAEGTAGYLYSTTMFCIAERGDADWGRILDDPDIPYKYKAQMLFEIAEERLGKGAAWSPYHTDVVIIPRSGPVGSWKQVNALLRKVLSEQATQADAVNRAP